MAERSFDVHREIDAHAEQRLAHFDRRHRKAAAEHEATGIRQPEGNGRNEPEQPRQRADRLSQLGQPVVDGPSLLAERFVPPSPPLRVPRDSLRWSYIKLYIMCNSMSSSYREVALLSRPLSDS